MTELSKRKCEACEGGVEPLSVEKAKDLLAKVDGWEINDDGTVITRVFEFKGFYKTMAFVNAVAWIANQELHHPDMELSFNRCVIHFTTHAINGLSENDFICAAKINEL